MRNIKFIRNKNQYKRWMIKIKLLSCKKESKLLTTKSSGKHFAVDLVVFKSWKKILCCNAGLKHNEAAVREFGVRLEYRVDSGAWWAREASLAA